jgi:hypothetical protein
MAYKQKTDSPLGHCWANVMHTQPWNKMRSRTAAAAGRGKGNDASLSEAEKKRKSPLDCWDGYERVPGTKKNAKGSCRKTSPLGKKEVKKVKAKGGGTKKVCLPKAKIASMSKEERQKVINAKRSAAAKGKYKRSSKSNVSGTSSGGSLKTWVKQDWRQVGDPSKKCGE